jgi:hypothetical protein
LAFNGEFGMGCILNILHKMDNAQHNIGLINRSLSKTFRESLDGSIAGNKVSAAGMLTEMLPETGHDWSVTTIVNKSKAVPLNVMEAPGRRGGIAPTHS